MYRYAKSSFLCKKEAELFRLVSHERFIQNDYEENEMIQLLVSVSNNFIYLSHKNNYLNLSI